MKRWGYIMGGVAIASVVAATIVSCSMLLLPSDATPENNILAYLNDIGFQAFYFFGFLAGACALLCLSNARSPYQDPKALTINIALFSTTRGYTYGALSVCIVSLIIYIILW